MDHVLLRRGEASINSLRPPNPSTRDSSALSYTAKIVRIGHGPLAAVYRRERRGAQSRVPAEGPASWIRNRRHRRIHSVMATSPFRINRDIRRRQRKAPRCREAGDKGGPIPSAPAPPCPSAASLSLSLSVFHSPAGSGTPNRSEAFFSLRNVPSGSGIPLRERSS